MALRIEELCLEAGFPVGAFQTLLIGSSMVEGVIQDSRVKGVTLTGSEPAGRAVAERAGANLKPSVLELGGADPFIIMPSADLDAAVKTAVKARTQNTDSLASQPSASSCMKKSMQLSSISSFTHSKS